MLWQFNCRVVHFNGGDNIARKRSTRREVKRKKCPICKVEKTISTGFYKSSSPLFSLDKCVPICTLCIKKNVTNEDGTVDVERLKNMCQKIDKPFYIDDLEAAYSQSQKENPILSMSEVKKRGMEIVGFYFKNINSLKQNKNKTFKDSEQTNFIHKTASSSQSEKNKILKKYSYMEEEKKITLDDYKEENEIELEDEEKEEFSLTVDIIELFGEGYTKTEYKKMAKKYKEMTQTYVIQTSLHKEALLTYIRFKVKEELATATGDVAAAQKWYAAAQDAADKAKLSPRQLSKEDLQGGIVNFSDIFSAVEGAKERIKIFPEFKYSPKDAADFIIWCYVNYERNLNNLPEVEYKDIYAFYDKKKKEYVEAYGDPYGIFEDDTSESNRQTIQKFITVPREFADEE